MSVQGNPRLLAQLMEETSRPRLTLLRAPAGYGKTSTVVLWLGDGSDPADGVRWIRCAPQPAGREPADVLWKILEDVLAVATGASPPLGENPISSAKRLAKGLTSPLTVVIDDYHHATNAESDLALADLCSAAPLLSLVVIGRRLRVLDGPLVGSRIRVRSFGPGDLSIDLEEALGIASQLGIPDGERMRIAIEQADGWPLALRAALDPTGLLHEEAMDAGTSSFAPSTEPAATDPLANLNSFTLHHLEIVGDVARHLLLAASQLDAIDLDQAAGFLGVEPGQARAAAHELIELGVLVAVPAEGTTEFRCHRAVRPALAVRSRRSLSPEQLRQLYRGRAAQIEGTAPFTAFKLYCAAEAYSEAESTLARHFVTITDEAEETSKLLGSLPEAVLLAHPALTSARLFLETPNAAVPASTLVYLTGLWQQGIQNRLANAHDTGIARFSLLNQAMVSARIHGDVESANRIADELEAKFIAALPDETPPVGGPERSPNASEYARISGGLPMYYRELAATALMAGDFERARRNWERLRAHSERLARAPWHGFPHASTRSVTDTESGHRWLLTALNGMAFTELLDGDMRRCAELLAEAEALAVTTGASAPGLSWVGGEIVRAHLSYELREEALLVHATARLQPLADRIEQWPLLLIAEAASARYLRGADWALAQLHARLAAIDTSQQPLARWNSYITGFRIMLHTVIGDLTSSERLLASFPAESSIGRLEGARLALFSGNDVEALLLAQQVADTESTKRQRLDRCLIATVAAWSCGKPQEAFASLRNVAELLEACNLPSMLWSIPLEPLREAAVAARDAGVCDIVDLVDAVPETARCRRYERLTEMELRTLSAIAEHRNAAQAAAALFITPGTVKKHLASVYRKLHVRGRDEAILQATRMGLLSAGVRRNPAA